MITTYDRDTGERHGYCRECGVVGWMDDANEGVCNDCTELHAKLSDPGALDDFEIRDPTK